ncbi:microfibril-associated glycoprotein 4-like [Stylophora pistillata]|uniref:Fibrinogen C domain-containing protein 1 n=1 Tax=Stylophora pistillata TaxID=50429 RepID=A0A2B4RAQ8_STYPI|nr:microfibril-associated glycoprotein 4-like [Stylophora pistillata]PFX13458.1 Fibrinogen C domain-containing protein 1 [Stylophora pistillata]
MWWRCCSAFVPFWILLFLSDVPTVCGKALSRKTTNQSCSMCQLLNILVYNQTNLDAKLDSISRQNKKLEAKINLLLKGRNNCSQARDCVDIYDCGQKASGVYTVRPRGKQPFDVFCDQITDSGGWTVFQKRVDGSVDFYRGWHDYKVGFGNLKNEFWLGLDKLNRLTINNKKRYKLRVDLEDTSGNTAYASYNYFGVSSEKTNYKLSLGTYYGNAGDSLSYHKSRPFSTKDRDNDGQSGSNCAVTYHSGWWFHACHTSGLNGAYLHGSHSSLANGINWKSWKGYNYSARRSEMKIRPVGWIPS